MSLRDNVLYATAVFCGGTSGVALRPQAVSTTPATALLRIAMAIGGNVLVLRR